MICCFKLITVIVDICMCIMSEGNLNQNKNSFFINFVMKKIYFIITRYSMSHKFVIMRYIEISF